MQITAEQLAVISLVAAIGLPLLTLIIQSRQNGRSSFQSEALARIQMLREQLDDCLETRAIGGGSGDGPTEPFMREVPLTPTRKDDA